MKLTRIAITLLTLLPLSAFADYRMIIPAQDKESIKFVNTEEVAALPIVDDPDTCSSNLPAPVMAPGYPKVIKAPNYIQYIILYTSVGNYANQTNITAQKYTKVLLTHTTGTQHGVDNAAWGDTLTGWQVNPGETIRVVVTPSSYDTAGNSICATGSPIELVNKTYEQLRNE
jgi:hypothetical protein